jgi:hypothetical protein
MKYKLKCDNNQELTMELNLNQLPDEKGNIPEITIQGEIKKLENHFKQIAIDKAATKIHPAGWDDPLPTKIVSYKLIA